MKKQYKKKGEATINYERDTLETDKGCLEWQGHKNEDGYGLVRLAGKKRRAHREAWKLFVGEIPKGMLVLHNCFNKACINIEHLRLGTHKENKQDEDYAKLSRTEIETIRYLYSNGYTQVQLAKKYNCTRSNIGYVVRGDSWNFS